MKRVLFVCTGNTCRSPMAEMLFRDMVKGRADYEVFSAGVSAYPGDTPSMHTVQLMQERGLDMRGFRSRQLSRKLLDQVTHVFGMSMSHLQALETMFPEATDKMYLASEFVADDQLRGKDVRDPFGQGRDAYEEARDMLLELLPSVLAYIDQTYEKTPTS